MSKTLEKYSHMVYSVVNSGNWIKEIVALFQKKTKKMSEKQWLKECLSDYERKRTECLDEKTKSAKLFVSAQFYEGMEETLDGLEEYGRGFVRKKKPGQAFHRAVVTFAAMLVVLLVCAMIMNPQGIVAGIPNFILEPSRGFVEGIKMKINPDAISESENEELPELTFGYIPEGFTLSETEPDGVNAGKIFTFAKKEGTSIRITVQPAKAGYFFQADCDTDIGQTETIYLGCREILKLSKTASKGESVFYFWTEQGYAFHAYVYPAESSLVEKIIEKLEIEK